MLLCASGVGTSVRSFPRVGRTARQPLPPTHAVPSCVGKLVRRGRAGASLAVMASTPERSAPADLGAFIERLEMGGAVGGTLADLSVAVKDNFDLKGHTTGAGNPRWLETHSPATATAPAVQALLDAGARVVGKTHMDELAYSLNGENVHYGTPLNPAAPGRIPGGSSSGSAVAVCGELVDFALGSDTAGSVRVPASYCGLLGFRPTHGRISLESVTPLAHSFDTAGWFARDAATLKRVGQVLLGGPSSTPLLSPRWLVATDAFDLSNDDTRQAIYDAMSIDFPGVTAVLGPPKELSVASLEGDGGLEQWLDVFRVIQAHEVWANHGDWVETAKPEFGPGVKERFLAASRVTAEELNSAVAARARISAHISTLLGGDGVLALPTCPGPAPKLNTPTDELELFRRRLLSLSALAPLCRLPQVTLPIAEVDGLPVGLSLIAPHGADEALLDLAERLMAVMPPARGRAAHSSACA